MRFGPYELDTQTCELRKGGIRLRITGQPLQLLALLIERHGQVVTREQLRDRLWPENTFVDFEHSLNAAVRRLRRALADDADQPRWVETVPRHGYRFIGTIEEEVAKPSEVTGRVEAAIYPGVVSPSTGRRRQHWKWLAAGLVVMALLGAWRAFQLMRTKLPSPKSLAVLPFANASSDKSLEYLADGLGESIVQDVSRIRDLKVIASSLTARYRGPDAAAAGRALKVSAVLTGTVTRYGDSVVVRTELLDPENGRHIWGKEYTRSVGSVQSIENELASDVAKELGAPVTPELRRWFATPRTQDSEAYDLYLKGRFHAEKGTHAELARGLSYFQQAADKDPNYALAYSGLAYYYFVAMDWLLPPREANEKARSAAQKAIALDDSLPEAHTMLGVVHWLEDWDGSGAEKEFRRAIDLNPSYPPAREFYGLFLTSEGRGGEGEEQTRRAVELDPTSIEFNAMLGQVLARTRQTDKAIQQMRSTVELDPDAWFPHLGLGSAYLQSGQSPRAIEELREASAQDSNPDALGMLGLAYGISGDPGAAKAILKQLSERRGHSYVPPYDLALVYIGLGDKDRAFEWLDKTLDDRGFAAPWLKVATETDSVRPDPRYAALLRRLTLERGTNNGLHPDAPRGN